jgi:hypothetical protein
MALFLVFFWCSAVAGPFNSRFRDFNSRLGRREFPVRSATGIGRQRIDLPCCFRGVTAVSEARSTKFPALREKPGMSRGIASALPRAQ